MKARFLLPSFSSRLQSVCVAVALSGAAAVAQTPQLVSSDPPEGAANVSTTKIVVFRFNVPMDSDLTMAAFTTLPSGVVSMQAPVWTDNFRTMMIQPLSSFPNNSVITWYLMGTSQAGELLMPGTVIGQFTTGGTVECTNYVSTFTVAKGSMFQQTTAGSPTPYPDVPFLFLACSGLACSNLTSTNLLLTIPSSPASTVLMPPKAQAGTYNLSVGVSNPTALEGTYPNGTYTFQAQSPTFNRIYTLDFPASLAIPGAPHVKNFTAAQSINVSQDFVLEWDDFASHSGAGLIYVEVYGGSFHTPSIGEPNALTATAKSVTIPVGKLSANSTYTVGITFYDYVMVSNSTQISLAYRGATTELDIHTTDGSAMPDLILTNPSLGPNAFSLEADAPSGHYLDFQFNSALSPTGWSTLYGTNTPGGKILFTDPAPSNVGSRFYRLYRVF